MRILFYECKKIFRLPLVIFFLMFTMLMYSMFMRITIHPQDSADCVAENDLARILKEDYGYDTILPYENFGVLEEIRREQIAYLDKLVQESDVLKINNITTYEQLDTMDIDEMPKEIYEELIRIDFTDGIRQVFLEQQIDFIYENMKWTPTMGIEKGKELEAAEVILSHRTRTQDWTQEAVKRIAHVIEGNRLSLLPNFVLEHLEDDFLKIAVLLMVSCLIFILPYEIREHLSGGNALFATTNEGRNLWKKRYLSAMISWCFLSCIQFVIFCVMLERAEVLQYWKYPVNTIHTFFWFDMNLGTYLIIKWIFYSLIAFASTTICYLISRLAQNYIVGVATAIPTIVLLGLLTKQFTSRFLVIYTGQENYFWGPICFVVMLLGISFVIVCSLRCWDKRRDILT